MARRPPKPISPTNLHDAALAYLERFAASTEMVRRVLMRRVERAARAGLAERRDGARLVEQVVARLMEAGLVDDAAFAARRARSLHRRGASEPAIRARLAAQGIPRDAIQSVLAERRAELGDPDLAAAVQLARRRRLGPFRAGDRAAHRLRDLGVMARAGFGAGVAHRVVDAPDAASLDALVADQGTA
jgi:regulatory protein